ncbi:MAG: hypothetical protein M1834_001297 [Cirrosporium novae-zelandiae]|nr:MAG: hypothetical protein M1834_001297 [Cirrosporium novae-zelandiae]
MVKIFNNNFSYDYPFPTVTLAYFLRYPNPYSRHVLSTDVIDRHFDPVTQRLYTTRLHLKRSKVPSAILRLLPKGLGGSDSSGQSYILETSTVDIKEGWMDTEARNLEWTGVLSVVERQKFYRRPEPGKAPGSIQKEGFFSRTKQRDGSGESERDPPESTSVTTTVTFQSRIGQARRLRQEKKANAASLLSNEEEEEAPVPKKGFFASWSSSSIQKSIETLSLHRTREGLNKSKEGMNVVLERLRSGGLVNVLEGMRRDREALNLHGGGAYKMALGGGSLENRPPRRVPRHVEHDLFANDEN